MKHVTKVVLVGFMGSGKSSIAAELGPRLGFSVCEMDELIVTLSGYSSIAAIFQERGETYFRDLEAEVAHSLRERENVVISTGGGVISRGSNIQDLKKNGGIIIYLRTSFETISKRLGEISSRPLFRNRNNALTLYNERNPIYQSCADMIVDTDGCSVEEVCSKILLQLRS